MFVPTELVILLPLELEAECGLYKHNVIKNENNIEYSVFRQWTQ